MACSFKPERENYEYFQELEDDEDEALSLCDLPLNSEEAAAYSVWDGFSMEDQNSSLDQEFFEFFSENFTSSSAYPKDNIISCGKLIPYKEENVDDKAENSEKLPSKAKEANTNSTFTWKSYSLNKLRSSSLKIIHENSYTTWKTNCQGPSPGKNVDKYTFPMRKVSFVASPTKSRWQLFTFRMGRYPIEMELNDIKTRQNKLSDDKIRRSMKSPAKSKKSRLDDQLAEKREKSWWGLLSILGCKSYDANAMVKASLSCIPSEKRSFKLTDGKNLNRV